jgi:DNA-directed RNA polymerase specialized sigma24 family protein
MHLTLQLLSLVKCIENSTIAHDSFRGYDLVLQKTHTFLLKNLIQAFRRGERGVISEIANILNNYSKTVMHTYAAVLKPYGYQFKEIESLWYHYVIEFCDEVEFPVSNVFSYFVGYLKHRLYKIVQNEAEKERTIAHGVESFDSTYDAEWDTVRKLSYIACEENIARWYSGKEILDEYIRNNDSNLLSKHEKDVIDMRLEGSSYTEISSLMGLSYKQVIHIYKKGIEKLRSYLLIAPKTLQNATIF